MLASTRATWEMDPRKALAWLIDGLGLLVGAEVLRLRAKAEVWAKGGALAPDAKLVKSSKLAKVKTKLGKLEADKPYKPRQTPANPGKPL